MTTFDPLQKGYTEKLRAFFSSFFRERGVSAYHASASVKAKYPYIVYEFRNTGSVSDTDETRRFVMEVEAFTTGDAIVLERLLDFLEAELSGFHENTPNFLVWVELAYGRYNIEEKEPLKRKRTNFDVKFCMRGAI